MSGAHLIDRRRFLRWVAAGALGASSIRCGGDPGGAGEVPVRADERGLALFPPPRIAIEVTSQPPGANVSAMHIFGRQAPHMYRGVTPFTLVAARRGDIRPGDEFGITLFKEGHEILDDLVTVSGNTRLTFTLEPVRQGDRQRSRVPLPTVPADRPLRVRVTDLSFTAPAGWAVIPGEWEGPRQFRVLLQRPASKDAWVKMEMGVVVTPLHSVEGSPGRTGDTRAWDPEAAILANPQMSWYEDIKTASRTIQGHRGAEATGRVRIRGVDQRVIIVGWGCPESKRFIQVDLLHEAGYPARAIVNALVASALDHGLRDEPLAGPIARSTLLAGETWAARVPSPSGDPELDERCWRVLPGSGPRPLVVSKKLPLSGVATADGGIRYNVRETRYERAREGWPGDVLQFPLHPGKTWVTAKGESASVLAPRAVEEAGDALPIAFKRSDRMEHMAYYSPSRKTIVRSEGPDRAIRSTTWLSATAP